MDENPYKAPQSTVGGRPSASRRWVWDVLLCGGLLWLLWLAVLHSEMLNVYLGVHSTIINETVDRAILWLGGLNLPVQCGVASLIVGISAWHLRRSALSA